jgi:hypothetical protein
MPDGLVVQPPPSQTFTWRDWAALIVAVGFTLGVWHVDVVASHAQNVATAAKQASVANRQIGYRNRAAICDFTREFGGTEPKTCNDPELAPYRDRSIQAGAGERRNTTSLLCLILAALKQTAPQCAGGG